MNTTPRATKFARTLLATAALAGIASLSSFNAFAASWFGRSNTGQEADGAAVTAQAAALSAKQADWMKPFVMALYRDGEWGAVLNLNRLGLAAMEKQNFPLARKAFDEAITRVEAIYAADANAIKARSVFNEEKVKDFKGEPYERAMLYYYRGLLYAHEGDYQNARAAFLAADRHDSLSSAESEAFIGNFGMMKYLAAWSSQCDNDQTRATQLVDESRSIDIKIKSLLEKPTNSMVLVDAGPGPVKWGDGQYKEILKFKAGDGSDPSFSVKGPASAHSEALLAGDVNVQATTRGGREIDGIMNGKAKFKGGAEAVGDTAMAVGMQAMLAGANSGNSNMANAGMFGMFVGIVAKGVASATTPAADLRSWDSLPGKVMVLQTADLASTPLKLVVGGDAQDFPLRAVNGKCSIAWARTSSALTTDMGGTARIEDQKPVEANRGDRNKAFRAMLETELVSAK